MSTRSLYIIFLVVYSSLGMIMSSCDSHPGFEKLDSGIFHRLNAFEDCLPALADAEFFIMDVSFKKWQQADTGYHFELHHGALNGQDTPSGKPENPLGLRLRHVLDSMQCGEDVTLILPFDEIDFTYLAAYADTPLYSLQDEIELRLHVRHTFTRDQYLTYLMNAAQHHEISETDAIELFLMNQREAAYERKGDTFLQHFTTGAGDSIQVGSDIIITYTTHLMNEQALDSVTTMQFVFGRPGQLVGGFQYALSLMREGDHARVYLPSYLAFGEKGSSTGIIPRNTPVFFDVRVDQVSIP